MKILILSQKIPYPPKDGGAIAILELARGLAKKHHLVTMLSFNPQKHYISSEEIPKTIRAEINFIPVNVNTPIRALPALKNLLFSRQPYIAERFINKKYKENLNVLLSNTKFDIVQIEGPYLAQYIPIIRKTSSARIVIRMHNIEHEIWQRQAGNCNNILKKFYLGNLAKRIKKLEHKVLITADAILPITKRDYKIIQNIIPNIPCKVIPTGMNVFPENNTNNKVQQDLFFIGSLEWFPNQEGLEWFLNNCWPIVINKRPAKLHIAGRNAPASFIKFISKKGVEFHGEVENAAKYMEKYSIMIAPLLSGSGMRIKIVEAMAAGKCVITTGIGIEGIDAKHKKHLFIADTPEDFAYWCLTLLNNKELTENTAEQASTYAREHFDNTKITGTLHHFYKELISE